MSALRYGWDAPGIMLGFLGAAASGLLLAWAAARFGPGWLAWVLGLLAAVPAAPGLMMLAYGLAGKRRTARHMLDRVTWSGRERVLDVGTGAGLLLVGAAERLKSGRLGTGCAVGVDLWVAKDLSGNGVERTRRNLAVAGVTARVETADARALPFPDGGFDVVLSLLCLHNIEPAAERATACREIARVLAPGGVAVVGDYVPVAAYAAALRAAGLAIEDVGTRFGVALSPLFMVVARRPTGG